MVAKEPSAQDFWDDYPSAMGTVCPGGRLGGVDWEEAADCPWVKLAWGGRNGPNPTDRGKAGSKRCLLVEGDGGPLSLVVAGANVHDTKLLEATLAAIVETSPLTAPSTLSGQRV